MKKLFLLALATLFLASTAQAQETEVVVTFERHAAAMEARKTVRTAVPQAVVMDAEFTPLYMSTRLDASPPPQTLDALFETGALSVEVVSMAAQLAALSGTVREEIEALATSDPGYIVRAAYPGATPTATAADAFSSAVGAAPTSVEKRPNEVWIRVPESATETVADRLRTVEGVVAVRVE
jgi:hypothetical protein